MPYPNFLKQLLETGSVSIETPDAPTDAERSLSVDILREFESNWRLNWAQEAPEFHPSSASWASESLYRCCQLLLYRDLLVEDSLASECPIADADMPRIHYNVDLTFRFLPNLWRFAQREAEVDPLTQVIRNWCLRWPLSSVGAVNLADPNLVPPETADESQTTDLGSTEIHFPIQEFWPHPSLAQQYVDRIVEHKDNTRLKAPHVADRILAIAGDHLGLFQSIQEKLLIKE